MAETTTLGQRIQAEFEASAQRKKSAEQDRAKEASQREQGLAAFEKACEDLKAVWRPRLEAFAARFGDQIKVAPAITPSQRQVKMVFLTGMASMDLSLTAAPSPDLTKIVLEYDLLIVPMFFDYERHARMETPLGAIDKAAIGKWIDDRLISCVRAYLAMQDNDAYVQRAMVEDPMTKARFLPAEAKATLQHAGRTLYFATEASMQEYKQKMQIA
jgi:hypothetical protein